MKIMTSFLFFIFSTQNFALDLKKLKLPEGFSIEMFQDKIENARSMARGDQGTIFVGTREGSEVYAIATDKDGKAIKVHTLATNLKSPNGVAFKDGDLYVAEISRIVVFRQVEKNLGKPQTPEVFFEGLKSDSHHGWKYIAFGPDGQLYIPVGAPCNVCLREDPIYAAIHRLDIKTKKLELIASGVRNTVGFTWHPSTKELWFTDNGRDSMGDDVPACEINKLSKVGEHFGFPFRHAKSVKDPEYFKQAPKNVTFTPPVFELKAHVAPLGIKYYQGKMFPQKYHGFFVAEHGSWNRSKKSGYKINFLQEKDGKIIKSEDFITGFKEGEKTLGRPVDLLELPDGSMLISDDYANAIYRVTYKK